MGNVFFGLPLELTRALVEGLGLRVAVETGTYRGESTRELAAIVPQIHTVELSEALAAGAAVSLSDLSNVTCHSGSSAAMLRSLASSVREPFLAWLDAHWCGGTTERSEGECPVLAELDEIDSFVDAKRSCVLIDDARFFLAPPPTPHDPLEWPTFQEIMAALTLSHRRYVTVLDDVIIAVPPEAKSIIDRYALDESPALRLKRVDAVLRRAPTSLLARQLLARNPIARITARSRSRRDHQT